jgi:AcrR family transcriptional regulator
MSPKESTQDRIVRAFLTLAAEHGYEGTTTRGVAEAAGVNEVTLFRHFGDKESLARLAFGSLGPGPLLAGYEPHVDTGSPQRAADDLRDCLVLVQKAIRTHPVVLNPALRAYFHRTAPLHDLASMPTVALAVVCQALTQAQPMLRPEVDVEATALSLLGLVVITVSGLRFSFPLPERLQGEALFTAALRPLIRWHDQPSRLEPPL